MKHKKLDNAKPLSPTYVSKLLSKPLDAHVPVHVALSALMTDPAGLDEKPEAPAPAPEPEAKEEAPAEEPAPKKSKKKS